MTVRAKFQLQEVREYAQYAGFTGKASKTLVFRPSYDDTIPEDRRFYDATPSGEFTMLVNNPDALAQFKLGGFYYVDFNPVS